MNEHEFKISEENSNKNIFANFSFDYLKKFYTNTIETLNALNTQKIERPQNPSIIGDALIGKKVNYYNPNSNISVFSNFNNSAEETERQYIAATRVLKPVEIDEELLKEMEKLNLLDY